MAGTQLYDKNQTELYPITSDDCVTSNVISGCNDVDKALTYLKNETLEIQKRIDQITGDEEILTSLVVTVSYAKSTTTSESNIKDPSTEWGQTYIQPSAEFPYIWKRTTFEITSNKSSFYEIVASFNQNEIQTIYMVKDNTSSVTITYPEKVGEDGNPIEGEYDLTAYDEKLPDGWSEIPQSISASEPYLYMSTRKRKQGVWEKYSTPALLGKWSFDSKLEMKYQITTGEIPTINRTSQSPENWGNAPTGDFTGKLWMITATTINDQFVINKDGNIWSEPVLMAIVQ